MLKYLIIQLDDTSVSFCHYNMSNKKRQLIEIDSLKKAIFWSMKENLTIQFVYPNYILPEEYKDLIRGIDHADIVSSLCKDIPLLNSADIVVFDDWNGINKFQYAQNQAYVIRTTFDDLNNNLEYLDNVFQKVSRLNILITDIENFDKEAEKVYPISLDILNEMILKEYKNGHGVQINILTDRMMLDAMNNCGAGDETITLSPNGKFYVCPGFYIDGLTDVGDIVNGLNVKNPQLYKLSHAPICRICDAWHCKRCIWQNKKSTLEVNTPSREQCVMAHIERNASHRLLNMIRGVGQFLPGKNISEISYLDPFDVIRKN